MTEEPGMTKNMQDQELQNQHKKVNRFTAVVLLVSLGLFLFGAGYRYGEYTVRKNETRVIDSIQEKAALDLSLFWNVWDTMQKKYVDRNKLNAKKMLHGAIKGMVAAVGDPYTFFLTPDENRASKDDLGGKYEGIGAQLGMKNNNITVVAPLADSPAEKAGIRSGDLILAVNKENTKGMALSTAVNKIRGTRGTKVTLTLMREGKEPFDIIIVREQIKMKSVTLRFINDVALLKVTQFGDNTNDEWDQAVLDIAEKWNKKEVKGMVLDLRSNPGGYLESSVYLASEFLKQGDLIVRQEYADKSGKNYVADRTGLLPKIPVSVLIDQGSASASEILTGALRDHKRAKVLGKKSFGKGSVQEALDLSGGAGLHVTIAKWILPGGDWINGKGIKPQIEVENKIENGNTLTDETDEQMKRAIQELAR